MERFGLVDLMFHWYVELDAADWAAEARMGLVHEASNKARGVAQAATALVFGGDQERHPGGIEQAHEELVAVALQMERDLVRAISMILELRALSEKSSVCLVTGLSVWFLLMWSCMIVWMPYPGGWPQLAIEDKCAVVGGNICTDGVRALIYGAQQMASFNKTMSLLDAHTALTPFSRVRPQSACSKPTCSPLDP